MFAVAQIRKSVFAPRTPFRRQILKYSAANLREFELSSKARSGVVNSD